MDGHLIAVKNNLLEDKHFQNMQVTNKTTGLWMYLWFLDKMTSIDPETQLGVVLGGKPLKISEMGISGNIKTRRKVFRALIENEYILAKRTPYGHIVYVTKAFKIFGQKPGRSVDKYGKSGFKSGRSQGPNLVGLGAESGRSNKTIQLDNTIIQSEPGQIDGPGYAKFKNKLDKLKGL